MSPPGRILPRTDILREARAVAALSHQNILALFDIGKFEDVSYAVTELLEGSTLRQRLKEGTLPIRAALDYALQTARALAAAHARGLVHRDLKPENIFVTRDEHVKLLDFGLARFDSTLDGSTAAAQEQEGIETRTKHSISGSMMGTIGYMSPEQARGQTADARSDLFSLGAVLYEMLAGERAFRGPSSADVISAILNDEPPPIPARARASAALDDLIRRCLRKKSSERFQSAADVGYALQSIIAIESESGVPAGPTGSTSSTAAAPAAPVAPAATEAAPAIAVLPFADMSPAKDQDYFCEGMAEEILSALSGIQGLRAAPPFSSRERRRMCAGSEKRSASTRSSRGACGRRGAGCE